MPQYKFFYFVVKYDLYIFNTFFFILVTATNKQTNKCKFPQKISKKKTMNFAF